MTLSAAPDPVRERDEADLRGEPSRRATFKTRSRVRATVDAATFLAVTVSLFAIVNPVGSVPVLVTLTRGYSPTEKRHVVTRGVLVGAGVLVVFGIAGRWVFDAFGITLPAFRIAGGILIFKYAFELLQGERPKADSNDKELEDALERESVGITPLGVPLLTGPGAITTMMILVSTQEGLTDQTLVFLAVGLVFAATFLILIAADRLLERLGRSGLMITARIMGLLLAAVAVQFVLTGLTQVAPTLFQPGA